MFKQDPDEPRPSIWAEGHQHPKFDPRAFALASVLYARESLSGLLARCAGTASDFGQVVRSGRWTVPENRLGRTGRLLPSARATAGAILGGAEVLARASRVALPALDAAPRPTSIFDAPVVLRKEPAACAAEVRGASTPLPPRVYPLPSDQAFAAANDPDLQAIRALMDAATAAPARSARSDIPVLPKIDPVAAAPVLPQPAMAVPGWRREWLADSAAQLLGYGLLIVSVPWGMGRALLAHLNGEDLRKLVEEN